MIFKLYKLSPRILISPPESHLERAAEVPDPRIGYIHSFDHVLYSCHCLVSVLRDCVRKPLYPCHGGSHPMVVIRVEILIYICNNTGDCSCSISDFLRQRYVRELVSNISTHPC